MSANVQFLGNSAQRALVAPGCVPRGAVQWRLLKKVSQFKNLSYCDDNTRLVFPSCGQSGWLLMSWTSVNGLLIGQREPKEVESTKPIPQARTGGVPWTLARPAAVKGMMGPQPDCPINCNQGILPAKAPQEL